MIKVLVYGWYHHNNIGDELFIEAFRNLFPELDFVFTDNLDVHHLHDIDAVFFGGGSFLGDHPKITEAALQTLMHKKVFYIGVGVESEIHPIHKQLMSHAKMIVTRTISQVEKVKELNSDVIFAPDLVYTLQDKVQMSVRRPQSVLILPNVSVVPNRLDAVWKHAAWNYFKSEFSQFLDWLIENNYEVKLAPLCQASKVDDRWAINELIAQMSKRDHKYEIMTPITNIGEVSSLISQFSVVISQRYHGMILSEITNTPYISIHHHDKLKNSTIDGGQFISYYGMHKQQLINAVNVALNTKTSYSLPIETNIYETVKHKVLHLINSR